MQPSPRRLRIEPLEARQMLSLSTGVDPNDVLYSYPKDGGIEITLSCTDYTFELLEDADTSSTASTTSTPSTERLTAANMASAGAGGSPKLPTRLLRIALPADADLDSVQLTVETTTEETVPGTHDLAPAPVAYTYETESALEASAALLPDLYASQLLENETTASTTLVLADPNQTIIDGRDADVYATDAFLGTEYCTLLGTQQMGRWKFAEVAYTPFSLQSGHRRSPRRGRRRNHLDLQDRRSSRCRFPGRHPLGTPTRPRCSTISTTPSAGTRGCLRLPQYPRAKPLDL